MALASTGVALFNINGTTIHSTLSIPIRDINKGICINGERLKKLQERLEHVKYVIIDEKSMVGRWMLSLINIRLQQAFPNHKNEAFGGRSIIMFRDFGPFLIFQYTPKNQKVHCPMTGLQYTVCSMKHISLKLFNGG